MGRKKSRSEEISEAYNDLFAHILAHGSELGQAVDGAWTVDEHGFGAALPGQEQTVDRLIASLLATQPAVQIWTLCTAPKEIRDRFWADAQYLAVMSSRFPAIAAQLAEPVGNA